MIYGTTENIVGAEGLFFQQGLDIILLCYNKT
ncbi:hypothetical protein EcWSU1_00989 [Enterobacter ludwigii]|uniref:Uncharacterized protein n=1 Tax=Enterobacter ludwigii TaxID=299767 RepID=G8LPX5_9ENTR|nr:hypothetical protein EcWSU1_00989 [Enterobacter ludwigii]